MLLNKRVFKIFCSEHLIIIKHYCLSKSVILSLFCLKEAIFVVEFMRGHTYHAKLTTFLWNLTIFQRLFWNRGPQGCKETLKKL